MENEQRLRAFLSERFPAFDETFDCAEDLSLVVDSLGLFDLLEFVEREFNVDVPTEDFSPQKFSSIDRILEFIDQLQAHS
jgi:acyl carrier protein